MPSVASRPAGGGHLQDGLRERQILQAALEILAETRYDRLTMDAVAARVSEHDRVRVGVIDNEYLSRTVDEVPVPDPSG